MGGAGNLKKSHLNTVRLVTFLLSVAVITLIGMVLWAAPRGFVLSDEGFYLLSYQKGQDLVGVSSFAAITRFLFGFTEIDVAFARWLRIAATILGGIALGSSVSIWARRKGLDRSGGGWITVCTVLFVLVGGFVSYTFGPLSFSYNHFNCLAMQLLTAIIFLASSAKSDGSQGRNLPASMVLLGAMTALVWFIKPPTAVAFVPIILVLLLSLSGYKIKQYAVLLGCLSLGGLLLFAGYFAAIEPLERYYSNIMLSMSLGAIQGHGVSQLVLGAVADLWQSLELIILGIFCAGAWIVIRTSLHRRRSAPPFFSNILWMTFLSIAAIGGYLRYGHTTAAVFNFFAAVFITVIITEFYTIRKSELSLQPFLNFAQDYFLMFFLFIAPFVGSLGTNVGLLRNALNYVSFWFALLVILILYVPGVIKSYSAELGLAVFALLTVAFVYRGLIGAPFRAEYLPAQGHLLPHYAVEPKLRLDETKVKAFEEFYGLLSTSGFKRGDPIVGFGNDLGFIYLAGGKVPATVPFASAGYARIVNRDDSCREGHALWALVENQSNWHGHDELKEVFPGYPNTFATVGTLDMMGKQMTLLHRPAHVR